MLEIKKLITSFFLIILYSSCNSQEKINKSCEEKLNSAKGLALNYPSNIGALDSALNLVNLLNECIDLKKQIVDLKISLLVTMKKYSEAITYVENLSESDFTYSYKKRFTSAAIRALQFEAINDTFQRNVVYMQMCKFLEDNIAARSSLDNNEFMEIYTDLFGVKEKYLSNSQINKEILVLKSMYPDKTQFFDFFKKE